MTRDDLLAALSNAVPPLLAGELVDAFLELRRDVATSTLGRSAAGKFVESFVQVLQHLACGTYDKKPNVDETLRTADSKMSSLDEGLKICASRVARGMYTLRNKRNIAHKGEVDPNEYDLRLLLASAQWVMAELIRAVSGLPMAQAGALIAAVNTPVGGLVEDIEGKRLVHADVTIREEILILLQSYHPRSVTAAEVVRHLDRRSAGSVRNELKRLWGLKELELDSGGYVLTKTGVQAAVATITRETGTAG